MTGEELSDWLRDLAHRVEVFDKVDGQTFQVGPGTLKVPNAGTIRSWKHRHPDRCKSVARNGPRDETATPGVTDLQRSDAEAPSGVSLSFSSEDLKNTTTSESDRSSRPTPTPVVVVADGDENATPVATPDARITCPRDLSLSEEQIGMLEMNMAISRVFVGAVTTGFVLRYLANPDRRFRHQWVSGLATAVTTTWTNRDKRTEIMNSILCRMPGVADARDEDPVDRACRIAQIQREHDEAANRAYEEQQEQLWLEKQRAAGKA